MSYLHCSQNDIFVSSVFNLSRSGLASASITQSVFQSCQGHILINNTWETVTRNRNVVNNNKNKECVAYAQGCKKVSLQFYIQRQNLENAITATGGDERSFCSSALGYFTRLKYTNTVKPFNK